MAMIRAIRRNIARNRLIETGYTGFNHKSRVDGKSQFSKVWREFFSMATYKQKRKFNGR